MSFHARHSFVQNILVARTGRPRSFAAKHVPSWANEPSSQRFVSRSSWPLRLSKRRAEALRTSQLSGESNDGSARTIVRLIFTPRHGAGSSRRAVCKVCTF
jgi:hypothetical protein